MDALSIQTVADFCQGHLVRGEADATVTHVATDSRSLSRGDLFLALRGERFDGHQFVPAALRDGAAGVVVDKDYDWKSLPPDCTVIETDDTLAALQALASCYRRSLPLKVVAITGSNGKTSTKDIAATLLASRYKVLKTAGNLNNHIGVPLTLLRASRSHEIAVIEIGMNHPGEIAPLAKIASPDVAIITNIGTAHIEHMKTRDAIALEKGVLAESVPGEGHVILHANDEYYRSIRNRCVAQVMAVGVGAGDIQASEVTANGAGTQFRLREGEDAVDVALPVLGEHMVVNALLAVGAARVLGMSLAECAEALFEVQLSKGRLELKSKWGLEILDDSYNANPDSMAAAIRTLAKLPTTGKRIAVLGRMGELGSQSEAGHRRVGQVAAEERIDRLIGVGAEAEMIVESAKAAGLKEANAVENVKAAAALIYRDGCPGDVILLKGSRSAAMEGTLAELEHLFAGHLETSIAS